MTNEEILKAAIEKSAENGWDAFGTAGAYMGSPPAYEVKTIFPSRPFVEITPGSPPSSEKYKIFPEQFIFSHYFAKAFWTDWKNRCTGCGAGKAKECFCDQVYTVIPAWQYHLQQMVLEEEPLKYLAKFLKDV